MVSDHSIVAVDAGMALGPSTPLRKQHVGPRCRPILALVWKEWRQHRLLVLIALGLGALVVTMERRYDESGTGFILLILGALTGLIGANSFAADRERTRSALLALLPYSRSQLYWLKLANALTYIVLIAAIFFTASPHGFPSYTRSPAAMLIGVVVVTSLIAATAAVATLGIGAVGTVLASMTFVLLWSLWAYVLMQATEIVGVPWMPSYLTGIAISTALVVGAWRLWASHSERKWQRFLGFHGALVMLAIIPAVGHGYSQFVDDSVNRMVSGKAILSPSPNGRHVAIFYTPTGADESPRAPFYHQAFRSVGNRLVMLDTETGDVERIEWGALYVPEGRLNAGAPIWTPDGKQIAIVRLPGVFSQLMSKLSRTARTLFVSGPFAAVRDFQHDYHLSYGLYDVERASWTVVDTQVSTTSWWEHRFALINGSTLCRWRSHHDRTFRFFDVKTGNLSQCHSPELLLPRLWRGGDDILFASRSSVARFRDPQSVVVYRCRPSVSSVAERVAEFGPVFGGQHILLRPVSLSHSGRWLLMRAHDERAFYLGELATGDVRRVVTPNVACGFVPGTDSVIVVGDGRPTIYDIVNASWQELPGLPSAIARSGVHSYRHGVILGSYHDDTQTRHWFRIGADNVAEVIADDTFDDLYDFGPDRLLGVNPHGIWTLRADGSDRQLVLATTN